MATIPDSGLVWSEILLRSIFDSSPIPKAIFDRTGKALAANTAMLALMAVDSPGELRWQSLFGLAEPAVRSAAACMFAGKGEVIEFECHVVRRGGPIQVLGVANSLRSADGTTHMVVQLMDITAQKAAYALAVHRSLHDGLTGLANRQHFEDRLHAALAGPDSAGVAVFMLDLDRFKEVNDTLGHAAGDEILTQVARRLDQDICRRGDTAARIGGDEFWVLATAVADEDDAMAFATRILRTIAAPFTAADTTLHLGASIGYATAKTATDGPALMRQADSAQYRAKELRSGWAGYSTDIDDRRLDRLALAADFRAAVAAEELDLDYQPLFGTGGRIRGFEALARWTHPTRGAIRPDVFIPIAEQAHLTEALTRALLRRAATQCAAWRAAGWDVGVAVNLAPALLHDGGITNLVATELAAAALPPRHLTLEVTEGRVTDSTNPMVATSLAALRDLGVRLSIDDFGTGYSSLAYLKDLPVHELKIDRTFITHLDTDPRDRSIVATLIQLAKTLGLEVVGEGVESEEVAEILRGLGCDVLQGFGLGRPATATAATELLAAQPARSPSTSAPARAPAELPAPRRGDHARSRRAHRAT